MMRSARVMVSACASVLATTKSTPCRPALIMLLTALPPPPPTPNTVIRGFSSVISGLCRLMVMVPAFPLFQPVAIPASSPCLPDAWSSGCLPAHGHFRERSVAAAPRLLKTTLEPLAHACDPAIAAGNRRKHALVGRMDFDVRKLRVDQQSHRRGECRT